MSQVDRFHKGTGEAVAVLRQQAVQAHADRGDVGRGVPTGCIKEAALAAAGRGDDHGAGRGALVPASGELLSLILAAQEVGPRSGWRDWPFCPEGRLRLAPRRIDIQTVLVSHKGARTVLLHQCSATCLL